MATKFYALIEFEAPDDAYVADIKNFFTELQCAGGCRDPEDPLFNSFDKVRVKHMGRRDQ